MIVVISLATAAAILGGFETVEKHMEGLCGMIELRGGTKAFEAGSLIEHKAERIDFGIALARGMKMRFMPGKISWSPRIAQGVDVAKLPELNMTRSRPDPRLRNIWADLKVFTKAANETTKTDVRMPHELFSAMSSSVPFRLVSLQFDPTSLPELMRLCLLAYMKSILLQLGGMGPHLRALADGLKTALLAQHHSSDPDLARFLLWALHVNALSIFDNFEQEWLRTALVFGLCLKLELC